jgi:hypothetical protein
VGGAGSQAGRADGGAVRGQPAGPQCGEVVKAVGKHALGLSQWAKASLAVDQGVRRHLARASRVVATGPRAKRYRIDCGACTLVGGGHSGLRRCDDSAKSLQSPSERDISSGGHPPFGRFQSADLACYSAHKCLGGPTAGIGRGMKVGKESIMATIAALEASATPAPGTLHEGAEFIAAHLIIAQIEQAKARGGTNVEPADARRARRFARPLSWPD